MVTESNVRDRKTERIKESNEYRRRQTERKREREREGE